MNMNRRLPALLAAIAITLASASARADVTAQWTSIAADAVRHAQETPAAAERGLGAVREAMAAARGRGNGTGDGHGNDNGGSVADAQRHDAAVSVAAFAVLETLYPDQREALDAQLAVTFSYIPETAAKAEGAAFGRRVATEVIQSMKAR